jgi:hypothetical protein
MNFQETQLSNYHWNEIPFNVVTYTDVFDEYYYKKLKLSTELQLKQSSLNYGIHRTNFDYNSKNFNIIQHKQNNREQQIVYDITEYSDYWYQNTNSVYDYAYDKIKTLISPVFYKYIDFWKNQHPFNSEPNKFIPYRYHINNLLDTNFLGFHHDSSDQHFKTHSSRQARIYSLTYYFDDYVPGSGGELCSVTDFVYHNSKNSAICMNGNQVLHGVTAYNNAEGTPRLAFTTRWAHIDDLYLPGSPDKSFWELEF